MDNIISLKGDKRIKSAAEDFKSLEIQGSTSHAYLIEGENITQSLNLAIFCASVLLCMSKNSRGKPCGKCDSCLKINNSIGLSHPDITILSSVGGKSSFHISSIRDMRKDAYILPNEGDRKVYILENAHDMTAQAQNALLKLLEEPPAYVSIFLLTKRREMMLDTVISRCQIITLQDTSVNEKIIEIPKDAFETLEILLSPQGTRFDFFSYFIRKRPKRDDALILLNGMRSLIGKLLIYRTTNNTGLHEISGHEKPLAKLASPRAFMAMADALIEAMNTVENNANINALFTALAYELWSAKSLI